MKNKALLIIDVQESLFEPVPKPYAAKDVIRNINTLSKWAREQGYPVIFIQQEEPEYPELKYESEGWQLQHDLNTEEGDLFVRKTTPDSFHHTDLRSLLEEQDIDELIICGYASDFCVDTTTRRAAALGYAIKLATDAHTTHDKPHASAELIRHHHSFVLSHISSFRVPIKAMTTTEICQCAD
ncbi:cysteine hydrolase [Vibrio fluvialis]|nr:cysteine hydrolase [Vibrio fluvialis]HDM8033455.1 cysteine hydrolase [Vibrio fluvialis clinical-1]EKO3520754.1 cysteine hydrolase [Vibrio fluvialis]EKO3525999.1 cysteine hydrolase [Vibrio fluvialis]EKO3529172.1 cysteine hydrolase [Vibrio fluvialis]